MKEATLCSSLEIVSALNSLTPTSAKTEHFCQQQNVLSIPLTLELWGKTIARLVPGMLAASFSLQKTNQDPNRKLIASLVVQYKTGGQ